MFDSSGDGIITIIIGVIMLLAAFCILLIVIEYVLQRKQLLYVRTLEEVKMNHLKSVIQKQKEVQDATFKAISNELSTSAGQQLMFAKLKLLNSLNKKKQNYSKKMIGESVDLISLAIQQLRDASSGMSADVVTNYGILQAIENEMEHIKYKKHKFNFSVSGTIYYLSSYDELIIYRILQEALSNIVTHSNGNEINIKLIYNEKTLRLEIKDNGQGFIEAVKLNVGNGITYIRKGTRLLSGVCKFSNDSGAKVAIKIPVLFKYEKGDADIHFKKLKLYIKPIAAK
ncbi:MAG: ATP-binding protein [Ferruginibacter sp.]